MFRVIFTALFQQHSDSPLTQLWWVTVCSFGCHFGSPFTESLVSRKPGTVHIDYSVYTQRIFEDEFSFRLPRSSHEQVKVGFWIAKRELQAGDLVFFKTFPQERHVGVYLGEGQFVHASSCIGVAISQLDNQYWGAHYEQAHRLSQSS
ncbi:NlpC/P60 family protein [Serratia fonticola]|uniref:NlpC/P60 family protein n=1 Tax=Serratia fonticola TaxID=47917 RepID=UPI001C4767D0|nr:NlpC/P60 family protein [Serratia fonticola]QXN65165.1 C40 family peptidase [Serratia fonticola]